MSTKYRIEPTKPGIDYRPYEYRTTYEGAVKLAERKFAERSHRDFLRPAVIRVFRSDDVVGAWSHGRGYRRWKMVAKVWPDGRIEEVSS